MHSQPSYRMSAHSQGTIAAEQREVALKRVEMEFGEMDEIVST